MTLTKEQINFYHQEGYLLVENSFSLDDVKILNQQWATIYATDTPGRVLEEETDIVRMVHGVHKNNPVFSRLVQHPKMLMPAMQLLDDHQVYVHQSKINAKMAFVGDVWAWHQDYTFWAKKDGMPNPHTLNATVFLSEVNEFNGPLMVIPKTHKIGLYDDTKKEVNLQEDEPDWMSQMTVNLEYSLEQETIAHYVEKYGIVAPKGAAGSILFFHPSIFHGSAANMSPVNRALALISYNSVKNKLQDVKNPRPWFLANRDFTPISPLKDNRLDIK